MSYYHYYYFQTDLICFIFLALVLKHTRLNDKSNSASQRLFALLTISTMFCAVSDLLAALLRGASFTGARFAIEFVNLVYLESLTVCSVAWCSYVSHKMAVRYTPVLKFLLKIPFIVITLMVVTNPLTNFIFSINEENLYVRGSGIFFHWIACWFYLLYITVLLILRLRKEKSRITRAEIKPMIGFILAPAAAAVFQMAMYGITTSQVGITLSIVMICMSMQDSMISQDELTGICNRKELNRFVEDAVNDTERTHMIVTMIDINNFKKINDTYGHSVGDITLIATARALKRACDKFDNSLFLCRYGGDEFVITGYCTPAITAQSVRDAIQQEIAKAASDSNVPCAFDVSIGSSVGTCETISDFDHHLRLADESMYDDKKHYSKSSI